MPLTPKDRRTLIVGGIVLGVILVGFLVFNLLSGGGNGALPPISGGVHSPTKAASPTGTNQPNPPPAAAGRDPFSIPPGMGGSVTPSGSVSPTPSGSQSQTPTPTLPGNGSAFRIGGHTVVLVSVYGVSGVNHAQVEVDGVIFNPSVGAHFDGGQFQLRSTNGTCANFLFGDQAFSLCTNPLK